MNGTKHNIDPEIEFEEDDDESSLPASIEEAGEISAAEIPALAAGTAAIAAFARHAPSAPGVYRMIDAKGEVLYVGKAKNIRKRLTAYTRAGGHTSRIARMIAVTSSLEFVSTGTETEALLLEANLIKRLRPRFNVFMRDDKSFPYILITAGESPPQICKHRGARDFKGEYFGPFASVWAVNRTITALQRAFLLRSCSDTVYFSRTRPCLLHQIKRCSAPCTGEVSHSDYAELVREARDFLSGKSRAVKQQLAREMDEASGALDFERAARYRDRLAALSAIQAQQGINPRTVEEADVFAVHQQGGFTCVEVFFFRTGQNWGNRAYFPKADKSLTAEAVLGSFLAQFYDDKPCPRCVFISHEIEDRALLAEALSIKSGRRIEVLVPRRGEKRDLVEHALANAREALGRKLAEASSQARLLDALAETFALDRPPRRIEVYDNSHIQGANAVGAMIVAGPDGFRKNQYRKFNIRSADIASGDDTSMMREVLRRRFKRLMSEAPRGDAFAIANEPPPERGSSASESSPGGGHNDPSADDLRSSDPPLSGEVDLIQDADGESSSPWPDLVLIDGGLGQMKAARDVLTELGVTGLPIVAVAKGPDRDAGRETFYQPGREPFRLPARDPVLYFVERLRDEAHRFAIGSHRQRRKRGLRESGLQEIPGIGPARKRALLHHFGTLKAIERASIADLEQVPGINEETARKIFGYFRASPS